MPKKGGGLGQFADLRWDLARKREMVFFWGEGGNTPMHTMSRSVLEDQNENIGVTL